MHLLQNGKKCPVLLALPTHHLPLTWDYSQQVQNWWESGLGIAEINIIGSIYTGKYSLISIQPFECKKNVQNSSLDYFEV